MAEKWLEKSPKKSQQQGRGAVRVDREWILGAFFMALLARLEENMGWVL